MKRASKIIISGLAAIICAGAFSGSAQALERPVVRGESLYVSGKKFVPYGYFYMQDDKEQMYLQEYFRSPSESEKNLILANFQEARSLYSANTIRIFLDMPIFMPSKGKLNMVAVNAALSLLREGGKMGLYFVVTSNTHTEKSRRLSWYDSLSAPARWNVQARLWFLLAKAFSKEPNIAWYEIANEPTIGKTSDGWYHGDFGDFTWAQHVAKANKADTRNRLARKWLIRMKSAVKSADRKAIVGAGLLPQWVRPESSFNPQNISGLLDVYPVHIYPGEWDLEWSVNIFKLWDRLVGGPVIVGEVYTLNGSPELIESFLTRIKDNTAGYLSFYSGQTLGSPHDYPNKDIAEANLEMFSRMCSVLCYN